MLRIDNMTMAFGGVIAANEFNANINKGEIIGLIGPNGAGKTTIFNVVTGVYQPTDGGGVYFTPEEEEIDIVGLKPDEIAKLGICRTFQNIRLFRELSVLDNVFIGNHLRLESSVFFLCF